eukprot:GHVU01137617.1.p1 GENE.GHVU01137617.1~~GHVU01137617.1.p1  ORF type:complete len:123 (+),score=11.46 GHVU01137617.1:661-1029(+)
MAAMLKQNNDSKAMNNQSVGLVAPLYLPLSSTHPLDLSISTHPPIHSPSHNFPSIQETAPPSGTRAPASSAAEARGGELPESTSAQRGRGASWAAASATDLPRGAPSPPERASERMSELTNE